MSNSNKKSRTMYSVMKENARLQKVVNALPHTEDGVPIVPGMWLWINGSRKVVVGITHNLNPVLTEYGAVSHRVCFFFFFKGASK